MSRGPNTQEDKAQKDDYGEAKYIEDASIHSHERLAESNKALTRRILLKLDFRLIPILSLLFLCSFLDRTNVGNAKILGFEKSLHITDKQYDNGLVVYYATYVASEIPSNLVLKRVSPKIWLPALTIVWGIITMGLGFVKNYAQFMVVRALLGVAEGGLLPGMVLYLSGMYTRGEMALRIGLFYTSASLSGAFGGLLARGLSAIGPHTHLVGWRWIFIVEGLLTVVVGIISYIGLPNTLETSKFLSTEEREWAVQRLMDDRPVRNIEETAEPDKFSWSEVRRGLFSMQLWLSASAYFAILSGLYSFGLFLPSIIKGFGYSPNNAQLFSVIPYAVAAIITVVVAILSDRLRIRGIMMLVMLPVAIIGYAVIANTESTKVKYGMTFLMATGLYSSVPCVLGWISNNSAGHYKRATTTAAQLAIANSGGFVAAFIYPSAQGPEYKKGHTIILSLLVAAWFLVLFNVLHCRQINHDKACGKYDAFIGSGDDRDPEFKMVL